MRDAHAGRAITSAHFTAVAGHLTDALLTAGVPQDTTDAIITAIAPLEADIVSTTAAAS